MMTNTAGATQRTEITRDGKTARIGVDPGGEGGWILEIVRIVEIVDQVWNSTAWDQTIATAEESMRAGVRVAKKDDHAFFGLRDDPSVH